MCKPWYVKKFKKTDLLSILPTVYHNQPLWHHWSVVGIAGVLDILFLDYLDVAIFYQADFFI